MKRSALHCALTVAGLGLAACTQFPELDHTQSTHLENADYPALVPLDPLLARASAPGPDPAETQADLAARLAGLRARAGAMRGTVLTGAEKQRLEEGLR